MTLIAAVHKPKLTCGTPQAWSPVPPDLPTVCRADRPPGGTADRRHLGRPPRHHLPTRASAIRARGTHIGVDEHRTAGTTVGPTELTVLSGGGTSTICAGSSSDSSLDAAGVTTQMYVFRRAPATDLLAKKDLRKLRPRLRSPPLSPATGGTPGSERTSMTRTVQPHAPWSVRRALRRTVVGGLTGRHAAIDRHGRLDIGDGRFELDPDSR